MKFRQFLLISIALLQFIAPLVHAHAKDQYRHLGLHLPTLEIYNTDDSTQTSVHSEQYLFNANTAIVSIAPGIKTPKSAINYQPNLFFLSWLLITFIAIPLRRQTYFFSTRPPIWQTLFLPIQAPRAPPVRI